LGAVLFLAGCAGAPSGEPRDAPPPGARGETQSDPDRPDPAPTDEGGPAYVTKGPEPLDPETCGVGRRVADAEFVDLSGESGTLRGLGADARATVVLFTGLGCPVTKAYAPLLEELTRPWRAEKVAVLVVSPAILDTPAALREWSKGHGWTFRVALDRGFALTTALGGRRTADAFLIDREGRLRYRGPINDQYGINLRLEAPREHYLDDAIQALLAGQEIPTPALEAPGCRITMVEFEDEG
jgi:peroxiredoxin